MRNLSTKGLSMSQAQSVSNLCNQRAQNIADELNIINNASKTITLSGVTYEQEEAHPMPGNVTELILEKARLHATQAFLMEALKAKEKELSVLKTQRFVFDTPAPERKEPESFRSLHPVEEAWGWAQLSDSEYNEYLEQEAYASHVGQFIHKRGILSNLREQISKIASLEWITIKDGEKTPVKVLKHHTANGLNAKHEELAKLHREYEQRVNYFKSKVKNLVTMENARIAKANADMINEYSKLESQYNSEYQIAYAEWITARAQAQQEAEVERETMIKDTAALRINVDPRFQAVVDMFLTQSED
jgi:hypothetical protein